MNKYRLVQVIIEKLERDQALLVEAARTAHRAATDPQNIPDNKYETLALESSYLAQGQANRAQDLLSALDSYRQLVVRQFKDTDQVYLTALLRIVSDAGVHRLLFLGPKAGGLKVHFDGCDVVVITPESPLGRDLLGKQVGDYISVESPGGTLVFEILNIT